MKNKDEEQKNLLLSANNSYSKSNFLISAKYSSSLLENKITAISLEKIYSGDYSRDKHGRIYTHTTGKELRMLMNANNGSFYQQLEPVAQNMTARTIGISDPDHNGGMFDYISVIDRAKYVNGVFTVYFNPDIENYISNLKSNFTILQLSVMLKFKSAYSFRLYELLSSRAYHQKGHENEPDIFDIQFGLSELKLSMGVVNAELDSVRRELNNHNKPNYDKAVEKSPEKKFNTWYEFKRGVLDTAIKEINEKTEMAVTFIPLKGGRGAKVYGVAFKVDLTGGNVENDLTDKNVENDLTDKNVESANKMEIMMEVSRIFLDLQIKDITTICETANYDLGKIRKAADLFSTQKNVKNKVGWIISCIKESYDVIESTKNDVKSKNSFHNFNQRDNDYEELEKKLLNSNPI